MSDSKSPRTLGPKALEMIMRDVLGGMEDLALMKGYQPGTDLLEIVAIDPDEQPADAVTPTPSARIVPFDRRRSRG